MSDGAPPLGIDLGTTYRRVPLLPDLRGGCCVAAVLLLSAVVVYCAAPNFAYW